MAEGADDFTVEARAFAVDADGNLHGEIIVVADNWDVQRHVFGEFAVKLHIAVEADAADDSVADMGIFPQRIAKFTNFLVRQAFRAMTPTQTVLICYTPVLFVECQRRCHSSSVASARMVDQKLTSPNGTLVAAPKVYNEYI